MTQNNPNFPMQITVYDTDDKTKINKIEEDNDMLLSSEWCEDEPKKEHGFLCYPDDGKCACGIHKHHVHCKCGKLLQIG